MKIPKPGTCKCFQLKEGKLGPWHIGMCFFSSLLFVQAPDRLCFIFKKKRENERKIPLIWLLFLLVGLRTKILAVNTSWLIMKQSLTFFNKIVPHCIMDTQTLGLSHKPHPCFAKKFLWVTVWLSHTLSQQKSWHGERPDHKKKYRDNITI